jgi:hypothetical protein
MRKLEEDYQDWKVKWGNEKRTIKIEKWNEEMREWLSRLKIKMRKKENEQSRLKNEMRKWENEYQD